MDRARDGPKKTRHKSLFLLFISMAAVSSPPGSDLCRYTCGVSPDFLWNRDRSSPIMSPSMPFWFSSAFLGLLLSLAACSQPGTLGTAADPGAADSGAVDTIADGAPTPEAAKEGDVLHNAAPPERPPSTVSLDPNCQWDGIGVPPPGCEGAVPTRCRPGLALLRNSETGRPERCGCPEGTEAVLDRATRKPVRCLCPSGEPLNVTLETGEAFACEEPREEAHQETEIAEVRREEPREVPEPECRTVMYGSDRTGYKPVLDCRTEEQRRADARRKRVRKISEVERIQDLRLR